MFLFCLFMIQPCFYPVVKYCFNAICFTRFIFVNSVIVSSNISCNDLSWAGLGFFRKKPISSGTPGKKWKKPISSSFVRTKLEETGKNCEGCQKCWKKWLSYLISYKRLYAFGWLVLSNNMMQKINYFWSISSSFIQTKLEETWWQLGKL